MTVGILIVIIAAAAIVASFGVGWIYLWTDNADGWGTAFWLGFGTLLVVCGSAAIAALLVSLVVSTWTVPL